MAVPLTDAQHQLITAMILDGHSTAAIAAAAGCNPISVRRRRKQLAANKTACSIDGCDRDEYGRTWCTTHYHRYYKRGSPVCVECGHDYTNGWRGMCPPCRTINKSREVAPEDLPDPPPCPHGCGRPRHKLPAIAAAVLRLPACPGVERGAA